MDREEKERENANDGLEATPEEPVGIDDKPKKKPSLLRKIMLGVIIALGVALLIVAALIIRLFSRVSRPQAPAPTATPAATAEPTAAPPTPSPTKTAPGTPAPPTPTPLPTPEPGPLPLEEYYTQTYLTGEQLKAIEDNKANKDVVNILLIGMDRRGSRGNYGSTDTIMVATLDKKNGRLKLTSMLRDLFVPIEGSKPWRINSIAANNGMPALIDTVNNVLRLNITNYVAVDFYMFEKIVDRLGGVTVKMSSAEISAANDNIAGLNKQRGVEYLWDGFIFANAGNVKLTGKQALGYSRIRHLDSDFRRTNRQFNVLTAIFAKFRSKNLIEQYALIDELLPLVETDLPAFTIIDMAIAALSLDTAGLLHHTVPAEGLYKSATVSGSYALLFDMPANALLAHEFIYNAVEEPEAAEVLSAGKSLPPRTPSPTLDPALDPNYTQDPNVLEPEVTPNPDMEGLPPDIIVEDVPEAGGAADAPVIQ